MNTYGDVMYLLTDELTDASCCNATVLYEGLTLTLRFHVHFFITGLSVCACFGCMCNSILQSSLRCQKA